MHQSSLGTRPRALVAVLGALMTLLAGVALTAAPPASAAPAPRTAARAPLPSYAGVPARWTPAHTYHRDLVVRRAGTVVHDARVYGDIIVEAPNVTLRRVDVVGGRIDNNWSTACMNGLQILRSTVRRAPGQATSDQDQPSIGTGGYLARRVAIRGTAEGFRVGGRSAGCGRVAIVDSYARIVAPDRCNDWHGDGLQGYDGPALTVRRSALSLVERDGCYGTAPFFYPSNQGNTAAHIDGLRVRGGGYPFRLGTPGSVEGLRIVRGTWGYGPYDVACSRLSTWRALLIGGGRAPSAVGCHTNGGS